MKHAMRSCAAILACALLVAACTSSSNGKKHASSSPSTSSVPVVGPTAGTGASSGGSGSSGPAPSSSTSDVNDRDLPPQTNQTSVLKSLPGSASSACGAVGSSTTDLRAGSMAAGNWKNARTDFRKQWHSAEVPTLNMYAIPQNVKGLHSLKLTVTKRGGAAKTITVKGLQPADVWSYFALQVPIPQPGSYRLTMVAGANRGCFDVTFAA
jgi:hypothetical protein